MTEHTKKLYVGWYDKIMHDWYPIGQIEISGAGYRFQYLRGAIKARAERALVGFRGIFQFPDFHQVYESSEIFAFFSNRLLTLSRDNFDEEVARLGFDENPRSLHPFDILARTSGRRATDTFEVFAPPTLEGSHISFVFFTRGVRYLADDLKRRWEQEAPVEPFSIEWDQENRLYRDALLILDADNTPLGYLPRYCGELFHPLIEQGCDYHLELMRHNREPGFTRERFLMKLTIPTLNGWQFPQSDLYDVIADNDRHASAAV